ncbi:D-aminoacyl-tRNA deacylase [Palleronia sp. KMU-117]|uniref:D-aminoacyl-tRNA deacylase n=1 Tax=Palleronia sp. KMU-117 TaxID=3434108 RepID=UPI003D743DF9
MRAVVQRVTRAEVAIAGETVGAVGPGFMVLVCAMRGDTEAEADLMAAKIAKLRVFRDAEGRMNLAIGDIGGSVLAISQFTLAADTSRGNRPGFSTAAEPETGARLYDRLCAALRDLGIAVQTGRFGAEMAVSLINDGPVTIMLDTETWRKA